MCRILVIGGYGAVGLEVVKLLLNHAEYDVCIAGHNAEKAEEAASIFHCDWTYIDVAQQVSIEQALNDIDIVINCFIPIDGIELGVIERVVKKGLMYIDVAGVPELHLNTIKALDSQAKASGALLITACGVNPGIVGILIKHHAQQVDEVYQSDVYFTMGAYFNEISTLSLMGMGKMIGQSSQLIEDNMVRNIASKRMKIFVGEPFNKQIYFNASAISMDVIEGIDTDKIQSMTFWSGVESLWISVLLYFGVKIGKTNTPNKASRFLKWLQKKGNKPTYHSCIKVTVRSSGREKGLVRELESSLYGSEVLATAMAPVIMCTLIRSNHKTLSGAYFASELVNPDQFIVELKRHDIHFEETL